MPRPSIAVLSSAIADRCAGLALGLAVAILVPVIAPALASGAVSVVVHDTTVTSTVRQDYTGTNFVAYWNDLGADPTSINDMKASRFGLVRFPGGIPCDWFDWQAPGSAGNRTIAEAWALANAGGGKLLYQTNIYDANGTGQNSATTVKAIDAYMKANGIQVGMWEGGNEPEYGPQKTQPAATYMATYNATFGLQYDALKSVSPSIPMIGPGTTLISNLALFLQAHGNKSGDGKVDGVSLHWYAGGGFNFPGPDYRRNAAQTLLANFINDAKAQIALYDTRALPIYITEWNWINPGGWGDYDYTFTGVNDADIVGMMHQLGVAGNTQFCLGTIAQSYGMIANWDGYRAPMRGDVNAPFLALTLAQKLGTSVLEVANPADAGTTLSAYATKTSDGKIQVMLCNRNPDLAQDVTLSFTGGYNPDGKALEISTLQNTAGTWAVNSSIMNGVLFPQPKASGVLPSPTTTTVSGSTYSVNLPINGSMAVLIFGGAGASHTVASISPSSGTIAGGTNVTISGSGFTAGATVSIGGTAATNVTVTSGTTITCTTPAGSAGARDVSVTESSQTVTLSNAFTYVAPAPTVASISPSTGTTAGGTSVTITGTNFVNGATTVTIGGASATGVSVASASSLTCTSPAGAAGARNVVVTVSGQSATLTNGFTYVAPAPTISSISPSSGTTAGGTSVTISGTGFSVGATVTIGGASATSVTVLGPTSISCMTPAGAAGARTVAVTVSSQTATLTNGFTFVVPAPVISGIAPSNGPTAGGTAVTITGTDFSGATSVTIGGVAATSVVLVGPTTITCVTPAGTAGAKSVIVSTAGQTATLTNGFSYVAPGAPTVSSISPSSGPTAGGTLVTITGTNFAAGATVTIGGAAATGVTVVSATSITCTTPVGAAGAKSVAVTVSAQTTTLTNSFTYLAPAPTISSISPASGSIAGGNGVTISGSNFASGSTVTIGGVAAIGVTVLSPTSISCIVPSGSAGAKSVAVTVSSQTASMANGYTYVDTLSASASNAGEMGGSPHKGCGTGGLAAMFTTLALLKLVGARRRDLQR